MKLTHFILFLFIGPCIFAQSRHVSKEKPKKLYVFNGMSYDIYSLKERKAKSVTASSTLTSKDGRYEANNVMDGKDETAWVEGVDGDGSRETLTFTFSEGTPPDLIRIVPGYNKSADTWNKNMRVAGVSIQALKGANSDEAGAFVEEMNAEMIREEDDRIAPGAQFIDMSHLWLQNMAAEEFGVLTVTIGEADDEGAEYEDTCISEISFFVRDKSIGTMSAEEYEAMTKKED